MEPDLKFVTHLTDTSSGLEHQSISYLPGYGIRCMHPIHDTGGHTESYQRVNDSDLASAVVLSVSEQDRLEYVQASGTPSADSFKWSGEDLASAPGSFSGPDSYVRLSFGANNGFEPVLTSLDNGGYVATWFGNGVEFGGTGNDILTRVFDSSGVPISDPFLVNAVTFGDPDDFSLRSDGGFVAVWASGDNSSASSLMVFMVVTLMPMEPLCSGRALQRQLVMPMITF